MTLGDGTGWPAEPRGADPTVPVQPGGSGPSGGGDGGGPEWPGDGGGPGGGGVFASYGPNGSQAVPFNCDGQSHSYTLTAHGQTGTAQRTIIVNPSTPPSTSTSTTTTTGGPPGHQ